MTVCHCSLISSKTSLDGPSPYANMIYSSPFTAGLLKSSCSCVLKNQDFLVKEKYLNLEIKFEMYTFVFKTD